MANCSSYLAADVHFIGMDSHSQLNGGIVRFLFTMFLGLLLIVPACNRSEPRSTQAASEQERDAKEQAKAERDDYVKSIDARLAEFDQKFDGLDKRAGAMTGA